ncbi:hypothetical protein GF339_05920 [candidate division KSB3 bacterium]|uniref:Heptaprenyl diphosphate synthase n=1 Tax=candidate division KSB3 bacterium TaxID=2044937 RepID=A0A9D5JUW9_9BACT|nr:hypothetical protein [candidate division KSB3 bacterium]MBD3324101.1 hypothetical protein [candidate division KSB3 bacterium]
MQETRQVVLLSLLIALAVVLRGLEGLIPTPLPWVRLGLANIMTLVAILLFGLKAGLLLTALRVLIASLIFGTFLSPTFFLSVSAGLCSTLVMGIMSATGHHLFSPLGISVAGGFTHNLVQLGVAYLLLVKHVEIFYVFPILSLIGILSGFFNGWMALLVYDRITHQWDYLLPPLHHPQKNNLV